MNPDEYFKLDQIDRDHWFYRGKRDIARHWIRRYVQLTPEDLLIDAGCGTGAMLAEMSGVCRVLGLDSQAGSIALARGRVEAVGGTVLQSGLESVPLADACAAVVLLLDVLEHLDDPGAALEEMIRLVRPGGLVVVTVPALRWLWSDWDEALHHRRRYHRRDLLELVCRPQVELLRCAHINTVMLLPIAGVRLWRRVSSARPGALRAEDRIPGPWLNSVLHWCFVRPACWSWFRAPLGSSLLAVLRRRLD